MDETEKILNGLKETIEAQNKKIKLYEISTNLDFIKVQMFSGHVIELENCIKNLEYEINTLNNALTEQKIKYDALEKQYNNLQQRYNH